MANPSSRPSTASGGLHFNLAHADGLVALAVAETPDIGVDVKYTGRRCSIDGLSSTVVAAEEDCWVGNGPAAKRRFCCTWTLKEAYAKARGLGLDLPLKSIEFIPSEEGCRFRSWDDTEQTSEWQFAHWTKDESHCSALAMRAREPIELRERACMNLGTLEFERSDPMSEPRAHA